MKWYTLDDKLPEFEEPIIVITDQRNYDFCKGINVYKAKRSNRTGEDFIVSFNRTNLISINKKHLSYKEILFWVPYLEFEKLLPHIN